MRRMAHLLLGQIDRGWLLIPLDLLLINACFLLCFEIRRAVGVPLHPASAQIATYLGILWGANALILLAMAATGAFRIHRGNDWLPDVLPVTQALLAVALIGVTLLFVAPGYQRGFIYSRLFLLLYFLTLLVALGGSRLLLRTALRRTWSRGALLRRVTVVGETAAARDLAAAIKAEPSMGYAATSICGTPENLESAEITTATALENHLLEHRPAAMFFVANRHSFRGYVPMVLFSLEHGLEVKVVTGADLYPYVTRETAELYGRPVADVTRTPLYPLKRWIKRLFDLLLASAGLLLLLPLLLLFALLVRLGDGGPALFIQRRVGKRGRPFNIFKFRTMQEHTLVDPGANIAEGPLTLIPNDPRVTPVGRWLRRHKLDELPQLLNVLLGQMSIVGPRPPTEEEIEHYSLWQRGRLFVKPGLTGLWQIDKRRKWRFDEMVELDLQYILKWTLLLDLKIMLRTIPAMLSGS